MKRILLSLLIYATSIVQSMEQPHDLNYIAETCPINTGDVFKHYKGNFYKIICISCHSQDITWHVVYKALYEDQVSQIWHCPLELFLETIEVDEKLVPQFEKITSSLSVTPYRGIDIQKVMDYKMPHVIARYCKDYNVSKEIAQIHEIELKRYLILVADTRDDEPNLSMLSRVVDNLWHTFLLFTKEYQAFCMEMFGKFIHHVPRIDKK